MRRGAILLAMAPALTLCQALTMPDDPCERRVWAAQEITVWGDTSPHMRAIYDRAVLACDALGGR